MKSLISYLAFATVTILPFLLSCENEKDDERLYQKKITDSIPSKSISFTLNSKHYSFIENSEPYKNYRCSSSRGGNLQTNLDYLSLDAHYMDFYPSYVHYTELQFIYHQYSNISHAESGICAYEYLFSDSLIKDIFYVGEYDMSSLVYTTNSDHEYIIVNPHTIDIFVTIDDSTLVSEYDHLITGSYLSWWRSYRWKDGQKYSNPNNYFNISELEFDYRPVYDKNGLMAVKIIGEFSCMLYRSLSSWHEEYDSIMLEDGHFYAIFDTSGFCPTYGDPTIY